ncbi:hypothetical protein PHMEG_0009870 [Phytophthora megakarya]|uniref:MULE transposase domain-containing protein n=1 Tax=Phytophthora megakarya TaxID=4795 RepID=A0A225WHJ6_9STRA|nr:hypothetical protein PHMEG_0009870 [Phytophthora megakarya]
MSKGLFDISTLVELMEWVASKECSTSEQFHRYSEGNDFSELIVFHIFHEKLENDELSLGIVVTSRRLFRNILLARVGHRHHGISSVTDGTYRLAVNQWTLNVLGCYGVEYTKDEYTHHFYPFAYMFVRNESARAYDELFRIVKEKSKMFFNYALKLQFGTMDHTDCIATAYETHWPYLVLLNRWPYLAGNLPKTNSLLNDPERYEGILKTQIHYVHKSRNASQFRVLSTLISKN